MGAGVCLILVLVSLGADVSFCCANGDIGAKMFQNTVRSILGGAFRGELFRDYQVSHISTLHCSILSSMVKGGYHHQQQQQPPHQQGHSKSGHRHESTTSLSSSKSIKSTSSLRSLATQIASVTNSVTTIVSPIKMKVYPIRALQDNYMYLLVDEFTKQAAAVDPVNASAMANAVSDHGVDLKCILTTHHHYDHAHGNSDMVTMYPDLVVYGGDPRVQALTKPVSHGEVIKLGTLTIECLSTPCHTRGHICYYVHNEELPGSGIQSFPTSSSAAPASDQTNHGNNNLDFPASPPPQVSATMAAISQGTSNTPIERVVFTGDTLFIAGCGRFFEGTSEQMDHNLNFILGGLPNDTRVYCGHEYTVTNLKFALTVEPQNPDIKMKLDWAQSKVAKREPTVPSTIGDEKRINPFMRLNKAQVRKYTREQNDLEVMSVLRQKKNEFVP